MGITACCGYREFKVADGYVDDVLAVVLSYFGSVRAASARRADVELEESAAGGEEFATFFIDGTLFALAAGHAQEAVPASRIARVSLGGRAERLGIVTLAQENEEKRFAWVYDLGHLMRGTPPARDEASQVVIVRHGGQTIGLLVDDLHGVPEFDSAQVIPTPLAAGQAGMLISQVIKANGGERLIQVVNVDYLFAVLNDPAAPATPLLPDAEAVFELRLAA